MADLAFRDGTWDRSIWECVARDNEYGLSARFTPEDVIVDIGAHIGAFSYVALDRGAGKVFAVEPDPDNFLYLRHNLHFACGATDRAVCISAAAWRSDAPPGGVVHYAAVGKNTGGGNTLGETGQPVAALSLDALTALACSASPSGRVRLIKLDCEGSEFPVLYTAHVYGVVDAFLGEYHVLDPHYFPAATRLHLPCDATGLQRHFEQRGYHFTHQETGGGLGKFRAWKPSKEI